MSERPPAVADERPFLTARTTIPRPRAPLAGVVVGACVFVITAYLLGARWLAAQVLFLPLGIWAIGAVAGIAHWRLRHGRDGLPNPLTATTRHLLRMRRAIRGWFRLNDASPGPLEQQLVQLHDATARPSDELRLGVMLAKEEFGEVAGCAFEPTTVVQRIETDRDVDRAIRALNLDGCLHRQPDGSLVLETREHPGLEAAWYDWSSPRPLVFSSLFAARVDPQRVTLPCADRGDDHLVFAHPHAAVTLIEAACTLARSAPRLTLEDRLSGRSPLLGRDGDDAIGAAVMARLAGVLRTSREVALSAATLTVARVYGDWLACHSCHEPVTGRREGLELVAEFLVADPATTLRLGAARIADFDDDTGVGALLDADALLRTDGALPDADQTEFLLAEIESGNAGPMALGRIAAGICLVLATAPDESLSFLGDDLLDDLRFAEWLVGRDQDTALLARLVRDIRTKRLGTRAGESLRIAA